MQSIREIVENMVCLTPPTIPLQRARVCLDCETVTSDVVYCPQCCSMQLWPIATWIDRKQKGAA